MEKNTKAVKAKKGSKEVAATDPRDVKAKALAQALAKIEKIGRASCRERV